MTPILDPADPTLASQAYDVSADGSIVVGVIGNQAFRWSEDEGLRVLGGQPYTQPSSIATGISADGNTLVGRIGDEAVRWTNGDDAVGLGFLPGKDPYTFANDVSDDGSVIAGTSNYSYNNSPARWTAQSGMIRLDPKNLSGTGSSVAVSADGSTIVGYTNSLSPSVTSWEAFKWTQGGGIIRLGHLSEASRDGDSYAYDTNSDGSIVVGGGRWSYTDGTAFIWDETHGIRDLLTVLNAYGANIEDWQLNVATGITPDGSVIVGFGQNARGLTEAWIATLPPHAIPEPGATSLLLTMLIAGVLFSKAPLFIRTAARTRTAPRRTGHGH